MARRHFSTSFGMSGINQHDSNNLPAEQPYVPMDNGPSFGPTHHSFRGRMRCDYQWNSESRGSDYRPSNHGMEVQYSPAFSGHHYSPRLHLPINGSTSLAPDNGATRINPGHYDRPPMQAAEVTTSTYRMPFKRKSPCFSETYGRGSPSSFFNPGSSSYYRIQTENPIVGSGGVIPFPGTSLSSNGDDWVRNVRSRSRLGLDINPRTFSSNSSQIYRSTVSQAHYSGLVIPVNLNGDAAGQERNSVPHYTAASNRRISTSDFNGANREMNPFLGGRSADTGGCHIEPALRRHPFSSSQNPCGYHAQIAREGHSVHSQRIPPSQRNGASHCHFRNAVASSSSDLYSFSGSSPSGYSRHFSSGGLHSNYSYRRSGITFDRIRTFSSDANTHNRMEPEGLLMVDQASFYGGDRSQFDQYSDMRLDVDSMTYEELLALEERIGNVNTGLSEDRITECLVEKVYCSLDQNQEEDTCPICLEEYKSGDKVGAMKRCGHGYHVNCIKQWLLMKNVCPICKAECSA